LFLRLVSAIFVLLTAALTASITASPETIASSQPAPSPIAVPVTAAPTPRAAPTHLAAARPARHPVVVRPRRAAVSAAPRHVSTAPVNGADVSWPNCPTNVGIPGRHGYNLPMPTRSARFVVVGATNGPAFTPNPCLRSQVTWVKQRHLLLSAYAVIHYPTSRELQRYGGRGTLRTRLARVGAAEAHHALATLRRAGLRPPMVWIDVETVGGHPWSTSAVRNRVLITGVVRELQRSHVRIGIYSYRTAWNRITRAWRSSLPTWVPTGSVHRADALARCHQRSFSGGRVLLGQWTAGSRDFNVTCPGVASNLHRLFLKT
jgi:hypothetical protein